MIVIILIFLALNIRLYFEKPIIIYENSLDNNIYGVDEANEEFFLYSNDKIGILLIHGLGSTPYQTKKLGDFLADKKITIYSVRLSGHGTNLDDLESKRWEDWYKDCENGYNFLKDKVNNIYILGVSSGALLAANLAENNGVDGLIVIGTPVYLNNTDANLGGAIRFGS